VIIRGSRISGKYKWVNMMTGRKAKDLEMQLKKYQKAQTQTQCLLAKRLMLEQEITSGVRELCV